MGLKSFIRSLFGENTTSDNISWFNNWLIGDTGSITETQAMQIPMLSAGVHMIAGTIAALPIKLYSSTDSRKTTKEITDDNRLKLLNEEPGDTLNCIELKERAIMDMLLNGSGYIYCNKYGTAYKSLHYVDCHSVSYQGNENPIFKDYDIYVQGKRYYPWQFIILTRNTRNGITGKGILQENGQLLKVAYNQLLLENALSRTGGNKKGFLKSNRRLTEPQIIELRQTWQDFCKVDSGQQMMILNDGMDFMSAGNTPVELQLNQSKAANAEQIGMIMLLPKIILTGTLTPQQKISALENAITPIVIKLENAINRALLTQQERQHLYFVIDTSELYKLDIKTRYEAYRIGLESNFLQPDEIRYKENLDPLGLDFIKLGLNDVLYDTKTKEFYTPNTDKHAKMGEVESGRSFIRIEGKKGNPYRDNKGKFASAPGGGVNGDKSEEEPEDKTPKALTSGGESGGKSAEKAKENPPKALTGTGKSGTIKKTKYAPSPRKHKEGITVNPKTYALLCSKFNSKCILAEKGTTDLIELRGYRYKVMSDGEGSLIVLFRIKSY